MLQQPGPEPCGHDGTRVLPSSSRSPYSSSPRPAARRWWVPGLHSQGGKGSRRLLALSQLLRPEQSSFCANTTPMGRELRGKTCPEHPLRRGQQGMGCFHPAWTRWDGGEKWVRVPGGTRCPARPCAQPPGTPPQLRLRAALTLREQSEEQPAEEPLPGEHHLPSAGAAAAGLGLRPGIYPGAQPGPALPARS